MKESHRKYHQRLEIEYRNVLKLINGFSDHNYTNVAFFAQVEKKRHRIENALNRLQDSSYGKCLSCGNPIHWERLDNLPYAELCLNCQQNLENKLVKTKSFTTRT